MAFRWSPERLDQLESAVRRGLRIAVTRRGNEFIVVATRMTSVHNRDAVAGILPMTNEEMVFPLEDIEALTIFG
jgi:uncharacterized protein with PhoU and TrkA domain